MSETQTTPLIIGSDNIVQQHKEPEHDFNEILTENTYHPECSQDLNASFVQEPSEFISSVAGKAKRHRKEGADKRKRKTLHQEKNPKH